jgi:hypothetical protein
VSRIWQERRGEVDVCLPNDRMAGFFWLFRPTSLLAKRETCSPRYTWEDGEMGHRFTKKNHQS